MLKKEDIEHLSRLARITISEGERDELATQIDSVLGYVSAVSAVVTEAESKPVVGELRNVLRDDTNAYIGGAWSDAIIKNAPDSEEGYFKVGQIF